jgi:hypothetical protein
MIPERQIEEFVLALRQSSGDNLLSVVLYGSAASGEFLAGHSDINLLCVLEKISFATIQALAPVMPDWLKHRHSPPMLLSNEELQRSADVFAIEFLDMKAHHKVLYGIDPLSRINVSMDRHRAQVEYELREKLIVLRQRLLQARDERQVWILLMQSLPAFITLFRHALIALGGPAPKSRREVAATLQTRVSSDISVFSRMLDLRQESTPPDSIAGKDLATRYLAAIQQVISVVDKMLVDSRSAS